MPTSFLDLPRELRDRIYILVLAPTGYAHFSWRRPYVMTMSTEDRVWAIAEDTSLALSRVNRQLYHETKDIFFAHNTIAIKLTKQFYYKFYSKEAPPHNFTRHIQSLALLCRTSRKLNFLDEENIPEHLEHWKSLKEIKFHLYFLYRGATRAGKHVF